MNKLILLALLIVGYEDNSVGPLVGAEGLINLEGKYILVLTFVGKL